MIGKKILIIDDESTFVDPIKLVLEKKGAHVLWASEGVDGLNQVRKSLPDLILLDLMLPGLNGYQICRLIKHATRYKNIPVFIVSANDSEKDKNLIKNCGGDLYITKPINFDEFVQQVKKALQ